MGISGSSPKPAAPHGSCLTRGACRILKVRRDSTISQEKKEGKGSPQGAERSRLEALDSPEESRRVGHFSTAEDVVRLADALAARVKAVAFDMDQCMVAQHSHGRLSKEGLPEYLSKVSPDFVALVPELESRGIHLAVTTHSDRAEYSDSVRPETHVLGEDLVESVLAHSVPRHKEGFFVVAYNPRVRLQAKLLLNLNMTGGQVGRDQRAIAAIQTVGRCHVAGKKHHIREVVREYALDSPQQVALFDDDPANIHDTEGCLAFQVDAASGFCIHDLPPELWKAPDST